MTAKELNQLVAQIETHIECWKQFNHFISLARAKKFSPADDHHFLEIKSISSCCANRRWVKSSLSWRGRG